MNHKIKARLEWVKLYQETMNAGLVCRRCGISRPTLRKWWRRFQNKVQEGLKELSRRPKNSPNRKVLDEQMRWSNKSRTKTLNAKIESYEEKIRC